MAANCLLVILAIACGLLAGRVMIWLDNRHFRKQEQGIRAMTNDEYMDALEVLANRRGKSDALDV